MSRVVLRSIVVVIIAFMVGIASTAAVMAIIPDPGSPPSIYDDFAYSSTGSGFWHVNADGATASILHGVLRLTGHAIELDHRIQTDPYVMVVSVKVKAHSLRRFGIGIGVYHAGTVGFEFDNEGLKCGRGTDFGWKVDSLQIFKKPLPLNQWFYLRISIKNPYPDPMVLAKLGDVDPSKLRATGVVCTAWDANGHLINSVSAKDPPPNTHYQALDEAFLRTWDSGNDYTVDWFYSGPPSGDPTRYLQQTKTKGA